MPLSPVRPQERFAALDALRGFALFGILIANWRGFGWPAEYYPAPSAVLHSTADLRTQFAVDLLCGNKFISLLSLLFGAGFAIQMERARDSGIVSFFSRRLLGLALIGAAHAFLIWWGDILLTYAAAGVLLLLFRNCRQRTLLVWAGILALLPLWLSFYRIATFAPPARAAAGASVDSVVARASRAYLHGSWPDRLRQTFHDWLVNNADAYFVVLLVLAWFLAGVFLWRSGFLHRLREHAPLLKRVCFWGLLYGIGGSLLALHVRQTWQPRPYHLPGLLVLNQLLRLSAGAALSLAYAAAIALFTLSTACPGLQRGLQAVGRTALSNYILQSIVGTTIHYGYGLALYGTVGALEAFLLSLTVFAGQMTLSAWYLSHWPVGPAEWLWRRISYGPTAT